MQFNKGTIITLLVIGIIALAIPVTFKLVQQQQQVKSRAQETAVITWPEGSIAKVGKEFLYQTDLNLELSAYPPTIDPNTAKDAVYQKMLTDSRILQGAGDEGLITLDTTIFNSSTKDYIKRIQAVKAAKETLKTRGDIQGTYVAIWFDNSRPSSEESGDAARKVIALQKITDLHEKVKSGQLTIKDAGEVIKNDASLAALDPQYKTNAILDFSVSPKDSITFSDDFDIVLKALNVNQVSDVALLQDKQIDTGKLIDAVYIFGVVTKKSTSTDYDGWIASKVTVYPEVKHP